MSLKNRDVETYVVVAFGDDGVQIVPKNWIVDGSKTYWPTFTNNTRYEKAVKNCEEPDPCWPLHDMRILGSYRTYETAKPKLKIAELFSDLGTDSEEMKKTRANRKRKTYYSSDSDSDAQSNASLNIKKLPTPPKSIGSSTVPQDSSPIIFQRNSSQMSFNRSDESPRYTNPCNGDCSRKIARDIAEIKVAVANILEMNKEILNRGVANLTNTVRPTQSDVTDDWDELLKFLPLKSIEEVKNFDSMLAEEHQEVKLVKYFSQIGGGSVDSVVKSILKRAVTNETAALYSWVGGKKKEVLSSLKLSQAVIKGVRGNFRHTVQEKEIVDCIKNWLRHGKTRAANETARKTKENAAV